MSALVYVETSIPSFYFETRPELPHQARRLWTREWWSLATRRDRLVSSVAAMDELRRAPAPKGTEGCELLRSLPWLSSSEEVESLIQHYLSHRLMPRDAAGDARHLAIATAHHCQFLVTWNCRHLANANKQAHIRYVNSEFGLETPHLVTPLNLLEGEL